MKKLFTTGIVLAGVSALFVPAVQAQTPDSSCYYQDASGQVIDLGDLCGPRRSVAPSNRPAATPTAPANPGPTAPVANRSTECRQLGDAILAPSVTGEIVPYPSTAAQQQQNAQVAGQLQQVIQAIAALSIQDTTLQALQDAAVFMYQDLRSLALAYNQVGASPTQNQGFVVDGTGMRVLMTAQQLATGFEASCGFSPF